MRPLQEAKTRNLQEVIMLSTTAGNMFQIVPDKSKLDTVMSDTDITVAKKKLFDLKSVFLD